MRGEFPGIQPLIQTPGVSNLARALFGMTADQAPKELDLAKLYPYVELGRRMEPDLMLLQSLIPWAASSTVVAVPAENSLFQVQSQPGWIVVVMGMEAGSGATTVSFYLQTSSLSETQVATQSVDTRFYQNVTTPNAFPNLLAPIVRQGTAAGFYAGRTQIYKGQSGANLFTRLPFPVILGPDLPGSAAGVGQSVELQANTVNVGLDVNAWGYVLPTKPR